VSSRTAMVATVGLAAAKPPRTLERHPSWALCRWVAAAADRWAARRPMLATSPVTQGDDLAAGQLSGVRT
jgi:hypothetical protein